MDENIRDLTVSLNEAEGREQESNEDLEEVRRELDAHLEEIQSFLADEEAIHARNAQGLDLTRRNYSVGLLRAGRVDEAREIYEQIQDEEIKEEIRSQHGSTLYPQPPRQRFFSERILRPLVGISVFLGVLSIGGYIMNNDVMNRKQEREERRIKEQKRLEHNYELGKEKICGKVIDENYIPASGEEDSKYAIKVQTEEGKVYGITVIDSKGMDKETLDILIDKEKKTPVCFQRGNVYKYNSRLNEDELESFIDGDEQMGRKPAGKIEVLTEEQ